MTDDGDDLAPVIKIRPGLDLKDADRGLTTAIAEKRSWCAHDRTRLDQECRRVFCCDCEREVPAFDALWNIAKDWERHIMWREEAVRRLRVADQAAADAERVERNAKSRARAALKRERDSEAVALLRRVLQLVRYQPSRGVMLDVKDFLEGPAEEVEVLVGPEPCAAASIGGAWEMLG